MGFGNSLSYENLKWSTGLSALYQMIREEDEENGELDYIEPLGAALAQRGLKKGQKKGPENTLLAFDNPAMSTTDLWWPHLGVKYTDQRNKMDL